MDGRRRTVCAIHIAAFSGICSGECFKTCSKSPHIKSYTILTISIIHPPRPNRDNTTHHHIINPLLILQRPMQINHKPLPHRILRITQLLIRPYLTRNRALHPLVRNHPLFERLDAYGRAGPGGVLRVGVVAGDDAPVGAVLDEAVDDEGAGDAEGWGWCGFWVG